MDLFSFLGVPGIKLKTTNIFSEGTGKFFNLILFFKIVHDYSSFIKRSNVFFFLLAIYLLHIYKIFFYKKNLKSIKRIVQNFFNIRCQKYENGNGANASLRNKVINFLFAFIISMIFGILYFLRGEVRLYLEYHLKFEL